MTDQSASGYDDRKRGRLIDAGAAAFSRVGFDRASVEEIAVAAGVGKGTVYLYFESKEELFLSVLWELKKRLEDAVAETTKIAGGEAQSFIRAHLLLADLAPDLFRCYTSALFGVNREFHTSALATFAWQQSCLREIVRRGGGRPKVSQRDSALIVGCINAAALVRALVPSDSPTTEPEERRLMMLLSGNEE